MRNSSFWVNNFYHLLWLGLAAKFFAVVMLFFLPYGSLEQKTNVQAGISYRNYQFAKILGYTIKTQETVIHPVSLPDAKELLLQAIYKTHEGGYIIVRYIPNSEVGIVSLNDLFYGYKVIEITPKTVVIIKDEHRYLLSLDEAEKLQGISSVAKTPSGEAKSIQKKDVVRYAKDFDAIWKNIKIVPLKEKGNLRGYKVTYVKKNSIFGQLGLEKNDVIVKVNGETLSSDAQAFAIYKKIDSYDYFVITVLRNGQERDLDYEIR